MKYILFLLFMVIATPAWACSCLAPTMEQGAKSFNESDIILRGTVTENSGGWEGRRPIIKLKVNEVIKGQNIPDEMTIDYNPSTAACGHSFTIDTDYILALYDTRTLTLTNDNTRGYGFRVMMSCHQYQIRNYIKNRIIEESEK